MTVEKKFIIKLTAYGMFESHALEVMAAAKKDIKLLVDYSVTWDDSSSAYPEVIYNVLWPVIKSTARRWLEENLPLAWYRPMFEEI